MRRQHKLTLGLAVVSVLVVYLILTTYNPIDGWVPLSLIFREDTVYSKDYTDPGFMNIRIGMSPDEVVNVAGAPLAVWGVVNDGEVNKKNYSYSRSPGDTHYRRRVIRFENDRVTSIEGEYWFD